MEAGYSGTFVIPCSQTEIDGQLPVRQGNIVEGATWRWDGEALRVDGPNTLLSLGVAEGATDLRGKAARAVRKLFCETIEDFPNTDEFELEERIREHSFTVTDGLLTYEMTLLEPGAGRMPLLMVAGVLPPKEQDLWVVEGLRIEQQVHDVDDIGAGVICFTPGTMIRTDFGDVPIETLREGDCVQTKDNGKRQIRWIGRRTLSGARLFAMPNLRPIRIRKGALIGGGPETDLLVSPDHHLLLSGTGAEVLFNTPEVLVKAKDLVNNMSIHVDHGGRDVSYIHLMFDTHEVIWANGVETESFHPAMARLDMMADEQRARMFDVFPELGTNPYAYGDSARRMLAEPEAALLCHERAVGY